MAQRLLRRTGKQFEDELRAGTPVRPTTEKVERVGNMINPYPTAFPYGNVMVLFYQQQESSTTKTVHKVINKGLKTYV